LKSLAMKFVAILLAAACLLAAIGSVAGMIAVGELKENDRTPDELYWQELRNEALTVAYAEVRRYQTMTHSTAPEEVIDYAISIGSLDVYHAALASNVTAVGWTITDSSSAMVSEGSMEPEKSRQSFYFEAIEPSYDQIHPMWEIEASSKLQEAAVSHKLSYGGVQYGILRCRGDVFSVEVMLEISDMPSEWDVLFFLYAIGDLLPLILLGSLVLFGAVMVYLCWVAGRKKGTAEIRPAGLNALPLDLYTVAVGLLAFGGVYLVFNIVQYTEFSWMLAGLVVILALLVCLLPVVYIFAIAAQVKAKDHFWWRRSAIGFVLIRIFRGLRWCARGICQVCRMIPVIWQWLLTALLMPLVPALLLIFATASYGLARVMFTLMFLGSLLLDVCIVLYGGWCFGTILKGAKRMAAGDLDTKIDTKYLFGSFRDCADQLNALSAAAMVAAREQMKSERMKTELITNVSHDIKTPLTSIINYVDLLQKPHTDEEGEQYLEVLSRQSARLKKLIEDLMDMSKASTGNVHAEITKVDAAEAVHQALGEFADKLESIHLIPVFRQPENKVEMLADGRLAWRVMSNLLSNVVKYAMPGTRLYVDVAKVEEEVMISFKNISAEPLNITAEELMERFVRGDASRNTEGSGLGLNIARSLMEVQGGSLQLLVDGDLFKVTLLFPCS